MDEQVARQDQENNRSAQSDQDSSENSS